MKYSIIIPTMWFHSEQLNGMLSVYNSLDSVGEILLINNNLSSCPKLPSYYKVRIIGDGKNMYVNPSWKLGVRESKYDLIALVNDDITVNGDIAKLFSSAKLLLRDGVIMGPSASCYRPGKSGISFRKSNHPDKLKMNHGFGVFMLMRKQTFVNTPIPNELLVWYGDHVLHYSNNVWNFAGIHINTKMRGTTSRLTLNGFAERERLAFENYIKDKNEHCHNT